MSRIVVLYLAVAFVGGNSAAAPWDFGVVVDVGAIHSDNILLSDEGSEESETIYTIAPQFALSTDGNRVAADIRYRPEALFFEDRSDADEVYHILDAGLQTTLIQDRFFIDFDAVHFQVIDAPENSFPTNNIPISNNRVETTVWSVRPRWQQQLAGAELVAEAGYRDTNFDSRSGFDNNESSGRFRLDNLGQQQGVSWGLGYDYQRVEYDENALPWEYQRASAELGYWVGGGAARVFVNGGVETPFDELLEPDMDDSFWEAGFDYTPNERMKVEFAAGERGYGSSFRGQFSYEMRRGRTELSYTERPSTQGNSLSRRRPIRDTDNLDDFLNRISDAAQFVRRRAQWTTNVNLSRTTATLRVFWESRDDAFAQTGAANPEEFFAGAALRFNWDVGARLGFGVDVDYTTRDDDTRDQDLMRFGLDVRYRLSRRFSLIAGAQRSEEDSPDPSLRNYTENQYRLLLRTEF